MKFPDDQFQYACPRGVLGAALLFWGWQSNLPLLGALLAALVEAAHWTTWRLPLTETHFIRIADLTSAAMAITGVSFFVVKLSDGLFYLVQWLPLITVFLLGAQLYSDRQNMPLKAIVATLRKKPPHESTPANIDLRLPYFFVTIIAASIEAPRTFTFLSIAGILVFWALWSAKPRRYKPLVWINFVGMSLILGFVFHNGLSQLQNKVQEITTDWLQGDWSERDLSRDATAIGRIGRLKLSEEIIMRVSIHAVDNHQGKNQTSTVTGLLLQQAEYNRYASATWLADDRHIEALQKNFTNQTWTLNDANPRHRGRVTVAAYLTHGAGVLPLPRGSYAITSHAPGKLSRNAYGAVRIEGAPRLLNYDAYFDRDNTFVGKNSDSDNTEPAVTEYDLEVPLLYSRLMADMVGELGITALPAEQAAQRLMQFFQQNFRYSLIQDKMALTLNPLQYFLRDSRKGHCEYFATAGVLLLRAAGIPARYVTGFSLSEYDADNNRFIVRKRHAHAWTVAYINGRWVELDFTPSTWAAMEAGAAPWWQSIYDLASNVTYSLYQWWILKPRNPWDYAFISLGVLALIYLVVKIKPGKLVLSLRLNKSDNDTDHETDYANIPGGDSPFYKIIHQLERNIAPRLPGETLKHWLHRIQQDGDFDADSLHPLLEQHYVYRFHPQGTEFTTKDRFETAVQNWLSRNKVGDCPGNRDQRI